MQYIYPLETICPIKAVPAHNGRKIPPSVLPELLEKHKTQSLRELAKEYGVSHEAVRNALKTAAAS